MNLLQKLLARTRSPLPPSQVLVFQIHGCPVSITFKRHASARRFTLRAARDGASFVLTLPKRASLEEAKRFALKSEGWIARVLAKQPTRAVIVPGASIPFRGETFRISDTPPTRGVVTCDTDQKLIIVPGRPEHLPRRLRDFLKKEALRALDQATRHYALAMGTAFKRLTVRDQKSRWGSCSSDGSLSYSWRLILAPPFVLDYVAAHEVAHLLEMNHGPRFWRLVLKHCARTRDAKAWLKTHGPSLHSV